MKQGKLVTTGIVVFILLMIILTISSATFLTIEAGKRGVIFRRFSGGLDKENIFQPGFHIIAPWNEVFEYSVREQQLEEKMDVLSSNGLNISVDVTVRVNPQYNKIGNLHEKFGIHYIETLVRPEVRSSVRKVIGRFTPEELYSTKRDEVQQMIQEELEDVLGKNFVELKAALIRSVQLPESLQAAIERKLKEEQSSLEYEFRLERERKEAERRIIEAQAKAKSNEILNASLTDKILRDKGIEATLDLAKSGNTKVVIVGGGGDGLPLILNQ